MDIALLESAIETKIIERPQRNENAVPAKNPHIDMLASYLELEKDKRKKLLGAITIPQLRAYEREVDTCTDEELKVKLQNMLSGVRKRIEAVMSIAIATSC